MSGNGHLSRDQILAFHGREFKDELVAGWGTVRIQSLSDGEMRALQAKGQDEFGLMDESKAKYRFADRAIAQLVDPDADNLPMFGEADREKLAGLKPSLTRQLYSLMVAFEGGNEPDEDDDELKKSSALTDTSASSTA